MNVKKMIFLMISILMISGIISACSSSGSKETGHTNAAQESNNHLELSLAAWDIQSGYDAPNAANDTIQKNIEQQLNITIKPVQITWNDWNDKVKVWAASKQLPDIFVNSLASDNTSLYETWARQGVIKPLPDDLSPYPNLQKILSLPSVQPLKVDGKFYMIPRMTYADSSDWGLDRSIRYRKDWAAEAGYTSDPKSFEEFESMVKAVMAKHPGITGVSFNNKSYIWAPFLGSFPEVANQKNWVKENGQWMPAYASSRINEGIRQLRKLYTEGLIDKDFAVQKDGDGYNKFLSGQSFAVFSLLDLKDAYFNQFVQANPGVEPSKAIGYLNIWPAADGKRYNFVETPYWSETYFSNSISDEKFRRALKLLDYLVSDEYTALTNNGIESVDYKVEDGKSVSLLKENENIGDKYPITRAMMFVGKWGNDFIYTGKKITSSNPEKDAIDQDMIAKYKKFKSENTPTPTNFDIMLMSTPTKNKLNLSNVTDDLIEVIIGSGDPVQEWEKVVKGYDAKGLQQAIKEVNDEASKRGIE